MACMAAPIDLPRSAQSKAFSAASKAPCCNASSRSTSSMTASTQAVKVGRSGAVRTYRRTASGNRLSNDREARPEMRRRVLHESGESCRNILPFERRAQIGGDVADDPHLDSGLVHPGVSEIKKEPQVHLLH